MACDPQTSRSTAKAKRPRRLKLREDVLDAFDDWLARNGYRGEVSRCSGECVKDPALLTIVNSLRLPGEDENDALLRMLRHDAGNFYI